MNVRMRTLLRGVLAAIPVVMLVAAVPFVNHVEPRIGGLPFLLAWLLVWVLTIPLFLSAADRLRQPR
jgi:hypothetical protein